MKENDYPFTLSLSAPRLLLRPGFPLALTAIVSISGRDGITPDLPERVSFYVTGDDGDRPEVSLTGCEWAYGVTPQICSDGTATVFVRAGTQVNLFRLEAIIPGKSEPARCDLDVRESIDPGPTQRVTTLNYVSGKNQFAWDSSPYDLFHAPLIVCAQDQQGKAVPDARVEFSTASSSVSVSSAHQLTDPKGQTSSAYLNALSKSTQSANVIASCNGLSVVFDALFVVSSKLSAELSPVNITAGKSSPFVISATDPGGDVWDGLSLQVWLEKKTASRFTFTDTPEHYSTTVQCHSDGKAPLRIRCSAGIKDGYSENLIIQAGPVTQTMKLTVTPP